MTGTGDGDGDGKEADKPCTLEYSLHSFIHFTHLMSTD
jgi:hypothetical protein